MKDDTYAVTAPVQSQEAIGVCDPLIRSIYDVGSEYRRAMIECAFPVFGGRGNEGDIRKEITPERY
jgi:hypothetical protein